jgi:hypothetical protein
MARFRRTRRRSADSDGIGTGAGRVARRGLWTLARLVGLITSLVVGLIVLGIVLVVLEANRSNDIVDVLLDGAEFLVDPFDDIFDLDDRKPRVAVNWGIGAVVYAFVGGLIARLLRR